MAGHQLKRLAQSRGKVLRSSALDLCPKHWSVYTLLFSTVFLLLFCFLLFDIRTSPTSLLLHASNQLGVLRAQAGERYFQSTAFSSPDEMVEAQSIKKGRQAAAAADDVEADDDEEDDEKRKTKSRKKSDDFVNKSEENGVKPKGSWSDKVPIEELLAVDDTVTTDLKPDSKKDLWMFGRNHEGDVLVRENGADEKDLKKAVVGEEPTEKHAQKGKDLEEESPDEQLVETSEIAGEEGVAEEESIEKEDPKTIAVGENDSKQKREEKSAPSTNKSSGKEKTTEPQSPSEEIVSGSVQVTGKSTKKSSDNIPADREVLDVVGRSDPEDENPKTEERDDQRQTREKKAETVKISTKSSKEKPSETSGVLKDVTGESAKCDYSIGEWVYDESYPLYKPDTCPFVDGGFRCVENGRPSAEFQKYRWQPAGCDLPKFDPQNMLERLRGRRMAFVGDSIGRNNWESMLCMLAAAVPDKSRIYEINGEPITKHKGFLSFRFEDYNCTIEYYRSPYLVPQGRAPADTPWEVHSTFKLDMIDWSAPQWKDADILVFNSGHWWSYEKTVRGGNYFQIKDKVRMEMEVGDAFRYAMRTVAKWVDDNIDPQKTQTFWRSYAPVHFRGGTWKTGGSCNQEIRPLVNLTSYEEPWVNMMVSAELRNGTKNPINFLNITKLSEHRPDGHSSIWQRVPPSPINRQDCSHWCLPGVPDTWNEVLYATLLERGQGPWGDK